MNWNWDHLRFFLALAENRTLSLAARDLGVSHSTVLRRIKSFEKELETHLFDHTLDGYMLTSAGDSLYVQAIKMKLTLDTVSREIAQSDQKIKGDVSVTTTDTLGFRILPPILKRLQSTYPDLRIKLNVINSFADLANRESDIAIRTCANPPAQLIGRKISKLRFQACASSHYVDQYQLTEFPVSVANHCFINLDEAYRNHSFSRWLDQHLTDDVKLTTASGFITAYALCKAGLGITVLPAYLVRDDDSLVALTTDDVVEPHDLWMLSHADLRKTLRVRMVKNFLYEELCQLFD